MDTHFYSDWHPERLLLAVTTSHGVGIYSVDPETDRVAMGQRVEPVLLLPEQNIGSLKWSPDGIRLASSHEDGTIRIWDVSVTNSD